MLSAGTQKISWEIKLWAAFSSASAIKPSGTSCPTSEAVHVCSTLFDCFFYWLSEFTSPVVHFLQRGQDRCRHFVITQNQEGQFFISGDCQTYGSLAELIEYYKVSPIQPFGEYLTSSCNEVRRVQTSQCGRVCQPSFVQTEISTTIGFWYSWSQEDWSAAPPAFGYKDKTLYFPVKHFQNMTNISSKLCKDIHGSKMMYPRDFGDHLTSSFNNLSCALCLVTKLLC